MSLRSNNYDCVTASYLTGYRTVSELNIQSSAVDFEIYRKGLQKEEGRIDGMCGKCKG
jgi:hypothetical protein